MRKYKFTAKLLSELNSTLCWLGKRKGYEEEVRVLNTMKINLLNEIK